MCLSAGDRLCYKEMTVCGMLGVGLMNKPPLFKPCGEPWWFKPSNSGCENTSIMNMIGIADLYHTTEYVVTLVH